MILAVLVVSVAFAAEAEFEIRELELRAAADRAFMLGYMRLHRRTAHLFFELLLAPHLVRCPKG